MKLLLVEDEVRMAEALSALLQAEGYEVDCCHDGLEGEKTALSGNYQLLILDVMLPGRNGFEIAKNLRNAGKQQPILFLTARSAIEDKEVGFLSGGDDYLTKPFDSRELLIRLKALLRRASVEAKMPSLGVSAPLTSANGELMSKPEMNTQKDPLSLGNIQLVLDQSLLRNTETQQEINLFGKELQLLEYLLKNRSRILSKEQITDFIWGYNNEAEYNNVEVYISFVRKKLRFLNANVEIKTTRGVGYQLRTTN